MRYAAEDIKEKPSPLGEALKNAVFSNVGEHGVFVFNCPLEHTLYVKHFFTVSSLNYQVRSCKSQQATHQE